MRTLHTYRFTGEHATLSVLETADRDHVTMQMQGDTNEFEEFAVTLPAGHWHQLCAFNPFALRRSPTDLLRAVRFCDTDHGDVLEISETRAGDVVLLEMRHSLSTDPEDALTMLLSRGQWRQLVGLDLIGDGATGPGLAAFYTTESNGTVH
jgi:hypothetical protein